MPALGPPRDCNVSNPNVLQLRPVSEQVRVIREIRKMEECLTRISHTFGQASNKSKLRHSSPQERAGGQTKFVAVPHSTYGNYSRENFQNTRRSNRKGAKAKLGDRGLRVRRADTGGPGRTGRVLTHI